MESDAKEAVGYAPVHRDGKVDWAAFSLDRMDVEEIRLVDGWTIKRFLVRLDPVQS